MKKYAIFLNGEYPNITKKHLELLKDREIYFADGGSNVGYRYNIIPKAIIGDLDSIEPEVLNYYKKLGVEICSYSSDKDYTDFEIVLMKICGIENIDMNARFKNEEEIDFYQNKDIIVFGATGKRVDMSICNFRVLMHNKNMKYISHMNELIYYIGKNTIINNMENKIFSLIPMTELKKLSLKGFRYNLDEKNIDITKALVSNVIEDKIATVNAENGEIIIIIDLSDEYE